MNTIFALILLFSINRDPPPGTIKIKNIYVDKTELLNIYWREYIFHKKRELDSIQLKNILPDSSNFWYTSPENNFKPIVSVTYEQVMEYCLWRSQTVTRLTGRKVIYRLPTPTEWKHISQEVLKTDLKNIEKELKSLREQIEKDTGLYILADREITKSRIYDLFDNVSEMTSEKGIAMGSNNHELTEIGVNLTRLIKYKSQSPYLGFRCVAEFE